jgi:tagatose 6-phosphate kinase
MITTVTLNVSVDKAYRIAGSIVPGTVARVQECTNTAGGKGLNVTRVIDGCGEDVIATGFTGGFNGAYVEDLLEKDGLKHSFTRTNSETRSCINILAEDQTSTEYLEPGEPVNEDDVNRFLEHFGQLLEKSEVVTISGSMPKGVPKDFYATLIRMVKDQGKMVILDSSGEALKNGIEAGPTMIKPNDEELEAILGITIENKEQTIEAAKTLMKQGIQYVVVSMGADGAVVVSEEGCYHGRPPKVEAINTVGCGDSMVGAFAVALKQKKNIEEALAFAVAVSAANAMHPQTGHFYKKDMEAILPEVTVEKL